MANLEKRSTHLTRDICKILGVRPTRGQYQEIADAIRAELAPDPQATMRVIQAIPEMLADYEHCALDSDGRLDSVRGRRISKMRKQVETVLRGW